MCSNSVLQCVAVCCSVLQFVAVCCSVFNFAHTYTLAHMYACMCIHTHTHTHTRTHTHTYTEFGVRDDVGTAQHTSHAHTHARACVYACMCKHTNTKTYTQSLVRVTTSGQWTWSCVWHGAASCSPLNPLASRVLMTPTAISRLRFVCNTHCHTLQQSATHCNTLQHTATLCTVQQ